MIEKTILECLTTNETYARKVLPFLSKEYFHDSTERTLFGVIDDYIKKYKHHPAILFWELGNEYNYHPEWFEGDITNWYNALNTTAQKIKAIDQNHPVATAHGEIPTEEVLQKNPNIDIWGVNVYRWDQPGSLITEWEERSELPLYFSEAGADSFMAAPKDDYHAGDNQTAQADATRIILNQIFEKPNIVNGVTLFSFTDGWWKAGNPNQQDQGGWAPFSSGVPYDGYVDCICLCPPLAEVWSCHRSRIL